MPLHALAVEWRGCSDPYKTLAGVVRNAHRSMLAIQRATQKTNKNRSGSLIHEDFGHERAKNAFWGSPASLLGASGGIPAVSWAPLGRSGAPLGRSWAPLGHLLGALGRLLAGLGRSLGECCLSGAPRTSILRGFGGARGGFGTPSGAGLGRSVVNNGLTYALH